MPLTADWAGTSHNPMFYAGRVYFLSDRDGVMNVYSMDRDGHGLKEETHQKVLDVQYASMEAGRVVYQSGADLWLLDLKTETDAIVPITIVSDFDQLRDHWVKNPSEYISAVHVAPDGSGAVFTARGEVFTLPRKSGRVVKVAGDPSIRFRGARYMPDGKSIFTLSTETGETEFWKYPANGTGKGEQWTHDAKISGGTAWSRPTGAGSRTATRIKSSGSTTSTRRRTSSSPSPRTTTSTISSWSPDGQWLAFVETADNTFDRLNVMLATTGESRR